MIKQIRHILILVLLLSGAIQALAQIAMPDKVCIGTIRRYWVNGTAGSIYTWKIDGVTQSSTADNIDITWSDPGTFTLTVQEHQNNCDGDIQSGQIIVNKLTFTPPTLADGYCPADIFQAIVNPNPINPELDLTFHRPDYYIFGVGSTILDLDMTKIVDNCSLAANPISWTIDFGNNGSIDLSGTGQLSTNLTVIQFPVGDNKVTYTVTDAVGNVSPPQDVTLHVIARPVITLSP